MNIALHQKDRDDCFLKSGLLYKMSYAILSANAFSIDLFLCPTILPKFS